MKSTKYLQLIARISGILASAIAIYFIIRIGMAPENQRNDQIITINIMFAFLIFGFIIGWFREKEGGIILSFGSIITYLYFSYLPSGQLFLFAWLYGFVFAVPGILFLYLGFTGKQEKK